MSPNAAIKEPLIVAVHIDRERRAENLVRAIESTIAEFVEAHRAEILTVRADFLEKAPSEFICGCATWETYVVEKLNCSSSYMRRLLGEDNPASAIHDGSANRRGGMPQIQRPKSGPVIVSGPVPASATETDFNVPDEPEIDIESLTVEEYAVVLVETGLNELALEIARKIKTHGIPGKVFIYGGGGMDRSKGQRMREEREQAAKDYVPVVRELMIGALTKMK